VRQLANALERAAILADGPELGAGHLGTLAPARPAASDGSLSSIERETLVVAEPVLPGAV
jgi:DNA-binding NtrC family response regulator